MSRPPPLITNSQGQIVSPLAPPQIGESVLGHSSPFGSVVHGVGGQAAGGVGGKEEDRFLSQANDLRITREDRQEGYDPSLTLLAPRTQQADAERAALERSRPPSLPASSQGPGPDRRMGLPASSLPYASRDPSAPVISTLPRGQGERNKRRTTDSNSKSRNSRRHSKKQLSWWQKPRCLVLLMVVVVVVALGAGLGAGLGLKKGGTTSSNGAPSSGPTFVPPVSNTEPGVSVSLSSADGTVQPPASTLLPAVSEAAGGARIKRGY